MSKSNKLVMGCDDAALEFKNELMKFLKDKGYEIEDVGIFAKDDATVYPNVAERACRIIAESGFEKRGILICGTGIGMSIAANKIDGIRCALCGDTFSARLTRLHNDANVLALGASTRSRYAEGSACAARSVSVLTMLYCVSIPPPSKYAFVMSTSFVIPSSLLTEEG